MAYFKLLFRNLLGGTEKHCVNAQSGNSVPVSEPEISGTRRSAGLNNTTFDLLVSVCVRGEGGSVM